MLTLAIQNSLFFQMRVMMGNPETKPEDRWWDPHGNPRYAVCVMWFRDVFACKRWFESAPKIKQHDFPNSHPYQVLAIPLTFGRNQEPLPFDLQRKLPFSTLRKILSRRHFEIAIFFFLYQESGFYISINLSLLETLYIS